LGQTEETAEEETEVAPIRGLRALRPKLNVWRLARETRIIAGSAAKVLTLRDQHGKIIRTAGTYAEEKELEAWWKAYERKTGIEDLPASSTLKKRLRSAIVRLKKRGFKYRMKFGGVRVNPERGGWEYCRWEVFKATPWRRNEVFRMNGYFKGRYVKEPFGLYCIVWKDSHDVLKRYRLTSRKK